MISVFRRHLQGRVLRYTIYFVGFLVIFPSVFITFFNKDRSHWLMKVNSVTVDYAEFLERRQALERRFAEQKRGDVQSLVEEELFMHALMQSTAQSLGITISPQLVYDELRRSLPQQFFGADGKTIDRNALERALGPQFEQNAQNSMVEQLLQQLVIGAVYVPVFMVKDSFVCRYVNHLFLIAAFPLGRLIEQEKQQPVTEKELQDFYAAENRKSKRYVVPEQRSGIVWTFDADQYGITISEDAITKYYNRKKTEQFMATPVKIQLRHIIEPASASNRADVIGKMNALRQELAQKPELFAQRAKLLDFFARGTHDKALEQVAFRLEKEGDISQVFETKDGFNIIQLVARKSPTYKPLESVRAEIVHKMRLDRLKASFVDTARGAIIQEDKVKALEEFARARSAKQKTLTNIALDDSLAVQKIFGLSKNGAGALLDGDKGVLVLVTEIKRAYEPSFEQVKTQVTADYYRARAEKVMRKLLVQADGISSVDQFKQFVREHNGRVESTGWLNKQDKEKGKKLQEQMGDALERIFAMQVPGSVAVHMGADAGYAICLENIASINEQEFQTHKAELSLDVFRAQGLLTTQGFVASLCKNATIKVNEKLRINKG